MTFRDLVERIRFAERAPGERPVTIAELARRCGVGRQHLFRLMAGTRTASPWLVERMARGLGISIQRIRSALAVSARKP